MAHGLAPEAIGLERKTFSVAGPPAGLLSVVLAGGDTFGPRRQSNTCDLHTHRDRMNNRSTHDATGKVVEGKALRERLTVLNDGRAIRGQKH
jgi:hypothetical protein